MDANRFDTLLRSFGASRSRRALIPLVASLVLGGTVGTRWSSETEAKGKGKKKRRKKQGQGPSSPPPSPPPGQSQCPATCPECQQCVNGQSCTPLNGGVCQNSPCKICQGGACVSNDGG